MEIVTVEGYSIAEMPIKDIFTRYLEQLDARPRTIDTYRKALRRFEEFVKGKMVWLTTILILNRTRERINDTLRKNPIFLRQRRLSLRGRHRPTL